MKLLSPELFGIIFQFTPTVFKKVLINFYTITVHRINVWSRQFKAVVVLRPSVFDMADVKNAHNITPRKANYPTAKDQRLHCLGF